MQTCINNNNNNNNSNNNNNNNNNNKSLLPLQIMKIHKVVTLCVCIIKKEDN